MSCCYLVIPHIHIQNANALSSSYTIGFPALSGWLGFTHNLQRHLSQDYPGLLFSGTGIVCHDFQLHTFRGPGDRVASIIGTGNPLVLADRKGKAERPAFIESARCFVEASLVLRLEVPGALNDDQAKDDFLRKVYRTLHSSLKVAGGDIIRFGELGVSEDFRAITRQLMPGYALVERKDLMVRSMRSGKDPISALLEHLVVFYECEKTETHSGSEKISWEGKRLNSGWIVPVAVGFQGISELGKAENQRDPDVPHRFAEPVVTLGEFKMVYRINSPEQFFWHYHCEDNLYLCTQQ